jgi:hypothetical protein
MTPCTQLGTEPVARYDCDLFEALDMRVTWGIHEGDPLGDPALCALGDIYTLSDCATPRAVTLALEPDLSILADPHAHTPLPVGAPVRALGVLRLMATDGDTIEVIVFAIAGRTFVLPLCPIRHSVGYALIAQDSTDPGLRLTQIVHSCFATGTRITMADGTLRRIEDVQAGDLVLTRDHGAQVLRWAGKVTLRAFGAFAPVQFAPGAMGNLGVLTVAPLQRVFLYQRGDRALGTRAEVLIQARYLADGRTATRREGGFVTYHALAFDEHQIIYAEGVPVESLLVSRATIARLPETLAQDLRARFPRLDQRAHFAQDVGPSARPASTPPAALRA